ncbi:MAG: hypothetical protein M0P12_00205 [Paludibacteraceae bacterium]|nr:hypothetical protein [Paludibacteraceae bacterium]MCK9615567.1 hypothetical protein [Candidatus Omnitrophota bacterium]
MKIEVYKVTVKLTKSIVNQLQKATLEVLRHGKVLGYVVNVRKDIRKAFLISYNDGLFYISDDWHTSKNSTRLFRRIGKWSVEWDFGTIENKEEFLKEYEIVLKTTVPQIFV